MAILIYMNNCIASCTKVKQHKVVFMIYPRVLESKEHDYLCSLLSNRGLFLPNGNLGSYSEELSDEYSYSSSWL